MLPFAYAIFILTGQYGIMVMATLGLAEDYPQYKEILARHGIRLSRRFVIEELTAIHEAGYDLGMVRELLEKRPAPKQKPSANPLQDLGEELDTLSFLLDECTAV
jgi:hypothetical protein